MQMNPALNDLTQLARLGDLRAVARIKLVALELDQFLDLRASAYGDADRAELVTIARERASLETGTTFDTAQTLLIGDTPRDVAAGRIADVRVIAVASGRSSVEELQAAGVNTVLPDLTDLASLRRLIMG
ncbi:HAD hydrolase-like protein [Lentzea sp. NEAU-D13]|uniref:HAD hydrolase-like protein n=1 Tax=Lentzea alba TaxID=2714351 RepID=A0A7C9VP34_9PSEU|nr:HAD hydrolase-like protein [Lentzea alba]NGY58735.1 HAD hydrolase-like protein [Lentzea alba]